MASKGSVFSQTLLEITDSKLEELAKGRASFEQHREEILALVHTYQDPIKRLTAMADNLKKCFAVSVSDGRVVRGSTRNARLEIDLKNLDRFLAQARYDPSVSSKMLEQWQDVLLRHVELQSQKFNYASLYAQLTTEWLSAKSASTTKGEDTKMDGFEHVSNAKKLESRVNWECSVFEAPTVDQAGIKKMLSGLFEATPNDSRHLLKALQALRKRVASFEEHFALPGTFNNVSLQWAIKGLLASDLLGDEKKDVLRDFMDNSVILREISDVLEMRLRALQDWSWGKEVLLEERRQLNGTYHIYMHEDLLHAIFLQHIGIKWSAFWKYNLSRFRRSKGVWKSPGTSLSMLDKKRRDYYLGPLPSGPSVISSKQKTYRKHYFLSQLLSSETQERRAEDGEEEADFESQVQAPIGRPVQTARRSTGGKALRKQLASQAARKAAPSNTLQRLRRRSYDQDDVDSSEDEGDDDDDIGDDEPMSAMAAKQALLHLLSTDILIKTRLQGELTCFRSQIDSLYPSLPHVTIEYVLSYLGVSKRWIQFFNRFLQAPLKFIDDPQSQTRQRKNGTPGSHILSEVFGEVVLFCLDFQINQVTDGEILWRMQDDFWFWSPDHGTCVKAWSTITQFMKLTGLQLNSARTGSARMLRKSQTANEVVQMDVGDTLPRGEIRWGMLRLHPDSGRFEIDHKMVDEHIEELSRQLKDKRNSIFAWIQAWNTYAATFFTSNFGTPANCFGRHHVDNMLATHERIQRQVFSSSTEASASEEAPTNGSVIEYLKWTIGQRFGIENIPDGYFYFPTELGGLEVRSPFIGLLQIRDAVFGDPSKLLDEFEVAEKEAYRLAKLEFDSGRTHELHNQIVDRNFRPKEPDIFFSFEEYTKYREEVNFWYDNELVDVYLKLQKKPQQQAVDTVDKGIIMMALNALGTESNGILQDWYRMEPYWKWVAQLYGPEMIDRFGGFKIVDSGLLPMGMVSLFRSGRVKWQE
jgi:hypothetical protein